jgi:hypothetical protein
MTDGKPRRTPSDTLRFLADAEESRAARLVKFAQSTRDPRRKPGKMKKIDDCRRRATNFRKLAEDLERK